MPNKHLQNAQRFEDIWITENVTKMSRKTLYKSNVTINGSKYKKGGGLRLIADHKTFFTEIQEPPKKY